MILSAEAAKRTVAVGWLNASHIQGVPSELRLGFVDLDFECSTVCPTLPGLMGIWQKRLGSWERWWDTEIKVNPTQVSAL